MLLLIMMVMTCGVVYIVCTHHGRGPVGVCVREGGEVAQPIGPPR